MELFFYILAGMGVLCSLGVVASKNPVHSVFFLILVFCFASCIFLLLSVDFLAILFVVVYVGAIAVLFLFVVMMLNIKLAELSESVVRYVPLGFLIGALFLSELWFYVVPDLSSDTLVSMQDWVVLQSGVEGVLLFAEVLYTYYLPHFLLSGMILLLSMVACIVLTLNHSLLSRRQAVYKQVGRNTDEAVKLYKFL